jgi:hypothetical protein
MKKIHSSDKTKPKTSAVPTLAMSLLSQGNNGSFNKPFARKYGLYAAILLSELVYLQDLFIHKEGKGMAVEDDNGFLIIGFFRTYEALHLSTSIPLGTLKRVEKANNPINILRKLGIIMTTSTTVGESFKRVIVYSVIADQVQDHIAIATVEYYEHINTKRLELQGVVQPEMKAIRSNPEKKGAISDDLQVEHPLSCTKDTTVESKGLESEIMLNGVKYAQVNEEGEKDHNAQSARQVMHKRHPSNNNTNLTAPTNASLTTNPSGTNRPVEELKSPLLPTGTRGTNLPPEVKNAVPPGSSIEKEYDQDTVETLYHNSKGAHADKLQDKIMDFFLGDSTTLDMYTHLIKMSGLPSSFKASNKDIKLLEQLRGIDNSLAYTEAFADKIIRNSVLITCKKRKRAFGQLFVGINMKEY